MVDAGLVPIKHDQLGGGEPMDLSAEFRPDRSSAPVTSTHFEVKYLAMESISVSMILRPSRSSSVTGWMSSTEIRPLSSVDTCGRIRAWSFDPSAICVRCGQALRSPRGSR